MSFHWIDMDTLINLPNLLGFAEGHAIRDPRLWSIACILRAHEGRQFENTATNEHLAISKQFKNAKNIYRRTTGGNFEDVVVPKGTSKQTFYYKELLSRKSTIKAKQKIEERFRRINENPLLNVAEILEKLKSLQKRRRLSQITISFPTLRL